MEKFFAYLGGSVAIIAIVLGVGWGLIMWLASSMKD